MNCNMADLILPQQVLQAGNRPLANFDICEATPLYDLKTGTNLEAVSLRLSVYSSFYNLTVDISESIVAQILAAFPACKIFSPSKRDLIDNHILTLATSHASNHGLFCGTFGLNRLPNGTWIFVAGNEILGDCGSYLVMPHSRLLTIRLAGERVDNISYAAARIIREIEANVDVILPAFSYTLLCSVRSQINELGLTTFPVLYISGQQGFGKPMLSSRYCLLYDMVTPPSVPFGNLDACSTDKGILKELSKCRDMVILVDDLADGSSPTIKEERQEHIAKALRFVANGNVRKTASTHSGSTVFSCQSGIAFTGEFSLTAASDLSRLIEVRLTHPMRSGSPTDRETIANVFRAWMIWLLPHLDAELSALKNQLNSISGNYEARLETAKILLLWSTELFFRFTQEAGIVDQGYYQSAVNTASRIFEKLLAMQAEKIRCIQNNVPLGNLSWYILQGYRKGAFHVVPRESITCDEDCVVEKDSLCIRTGTLLGFLRATGNYPTLSDKRMVRTLNEEGVLEFCSEKRYAKKKIHGKRYLELSFAALQCAAKRY